MSRWTKFTKLEATKMLKGGSTVDDVVDLFKMSKSSVISLKYSLLDNGERIECQICHSKMKQVTVKHLNNHNISIEEYKIKFPLSLLCTQKRSEIYKNFKSPNKGKTYNEIYGVTEATIKKNKISTKQIGRSCPRLAGTGITGTRKDTNTFARSTYEANIDRIFIFENKKYIDELSITRFNLVKDNGETISYCPDRMDCDGLFKKGSYLEIKGYMYPDDWEKIKLFRQQYQNENLIVISNDKNYLDIAYNDLVNKYKNKIDLWETEKQNYKTSPDLYVIGYKTPYHIKFYQENYPKHINIKITDPHMLFIANKCLSFNRVTLGEDPYIEIIELLAISNKRANSNRKSSGEYNYELWKTTTADNKIFYITNQEKTTIFYCYRDDKFNELMSFFNNNNIDGLKYGIKQNKSQEYISNDLWDNSDEHKRYILQQINDKIKHKGAYDIEKVTNIILSKMEKTKSGSFNNYEEWNIYCNNKDQIKYVLTNFNNSTSEFTLVGPFLDKV